MQCIFPLAFSIVGIEDNKRICVKEKIVGARLLKQQKKTNTQREIKTKKENKRQKDAENRN
jgi:hypothetical protein